VRPTHPLCMSTVTEIGFAEALRRLHDLLGRDLRIMINFRGTFGGCLMQGRLTRVHTLPPDGQAIAVLLEDRQSLMLDPVDTTVLAVVDDGEDRHWLEFHLPSGVVAVVEEAHDSRVAV
jgi:hypothetical protein